MSPEPEKLLSFADFSFQPIQRISSYFSAAGAFFPDDYLRRTLLEELGCFLLLIAKNLTLFRACLSSRSRTAAVLRPPAKWPIWRRRGQRRPAILVPSAGPQAPSLDCALFSPSRWANCRLSEAAGSSGWWQLPVAFGIVFCRCLSLTIDNRWRLSVVIGVRRPSIGISWYWLNWYPSANFYRNRWFSYTKYDCCDLTVSVIFSYSGRKFPAPVPLLHRWKAIISTPF